MAKPKMFVGSSSEARVLIDGLVLNLALDVDVVPWDRGVFPLSRTTIESLEVTVGQVDFAAFLLTPEDGLRLREEEFVAPRDNVIFELGLFMGGLGRERCFMIVPAGTRTAFRTATDFLGMSVTTYADADIGPGRDPRHLMSEAAAAIRIETRRLGPLQTRSRLEQRRFKDVLSRGNTSAIASVADGALDVADHRYTYPAEIRRRVLNTEVVPSKYQYWTPEGSRAWLQLCQRPTYRYHVEALALLRQSGPAVAEAIRSMAGTAAIDLVSLGSGDGIKDNVLLRSLAAQMERDEVGYYYPVDITDSLLVEAVRNSMGTGLRRESFRLKCVLGDFLSLRRFLPIFEARSTPNVYSVLGNTIGNADEADIFASLADAMLPGDFVLIEFNVGSPSTSVDLVTDPIAAQSDFTPLASLGLKFDPTKFRVHESQEESVVEGARTIAIDYVDAELGPGLTRDVRLSLLHHYQPEKFANYARQRLDVDIIAEYSHGRVGLLLATRRG
jgi:uncharacterized SAM-dependent methyltransferase